MTTDPFAAYRAELRGAAVRHVARYQRRRRFFIALAVLASAIVLVGGAIAAESKFGWLASSPGQIRVSALADQFDQAPKSFVDCMSAHGVHRVKLAGGGWTYVNAAATETMCGAQITAVTVKCRNTVPTAGQMQTRCLTVVQRTFGPPLETHK